MVSNSAHLPSGLPSSSGLDGPGLVAGRYEIESNIASGGMGRVYVALNRLTGERVALKRLTPAAAAVEQLVALFKLEYQTLSQLRHPNIIEVYDFGVDSAGPYYTMELLDGHDLSGLAPLDYRQACQYLRDVATSLSLLHTRRIVHRDLSPKNVRLTSDGSCKLLDFGAMAHAGVVTDPVGTPPLIAPEALMGRPLDHRVDLYALGALAYWLLSGRHAYPAQRIHELPRLHEGAPTSLATLVPGIPEPLAGLVDALLHREPNARPPSAAYVIEVLTSVAELPRQRDLAKALSFVVTPALVGRESEMARIREALSLLSTGQGGRWLLVSSPGMGRSRLLSEAALEARLAGLAVVEVDAGQHRGRLEAARHTLHGVLSAVPEAMAPALQHERRVLSNLLPELLHGDEAPAPLPRVRNDYSLALGQALGRVCVEASRRRPLLLLVDDLHWADSASLDVLNAMCDEASESPVLFMASEETAAVLAAGGALERYNRSAQHLRMQPFTAGDTAALTRGIFGDAAKVDRVGRWAHAITLGNPGQNLQLASHLVERGVLEYADGRWLLVGKLDNDALPAQLRDAMRTRVAQLSAPARDLAEALALRRRPATEAQCASLSFSGSASLLTTLEELVGLGVVVETPQGYLLARDLARDLLLDGTVEERRRELHGRLAVVAATESGVEARLATALHMLRAGDEHHAVDLLLTQLERVDVGEHDLELALEVVTSAVEAMERLGVSARDRVRLRAHALLWATHAGRYVGDSELHRVAMDLRRFAGFALADRLARVLPMSLALRLGGALRRAWRVMLPLRRRPPKVHNASWLLGSVVMSAIVARQLQGRFAAVERLAVYLEPFRHDRRSLGPLVHRCGQAFVALSKGRYVDAERAAESVLAYAARGTETDVVANTRAVLDGYATVVLVQAAGRSGSRTAHAVCDDLERSPSTQCRRLSTGLREAAHLLRGEFVQAARYAKRRERSAGGSGAPEEVLVLLTRVQAYSLIRDLDGLKACVDALSVVAKHEGRDLLLEAARACHVMLLGRAEAADKVDSLVERVPPWTAPAWVELRSIQAATRLWQRRPADALQIAEQALALLGDSLAPDDIGRINLHMFAADAESALLRPQAALRRLEGCLEVLDRHKSPLLLGLAHFRVARLALLVEDRQRYGSHANLARRWFSASGHPSFDGWMADLADMRRARVALSSAPPPATGGQTTAGGGRSRERDPLRNADGARARAERALELLCGRVRASGGLLYLVQAEGPRLVARRYAADAPDRELVDSVVRSSMRRALEDYESPSQHARRRSIEALASGRVHPLTCVREQHLCVVGAVVLLGKAPIEAPSEALSARLATSFLEHGDASVSSHYQAAAR